MNSQKKRTSISELRVLACGVALKQYPRDDMLLKGLFGLGVNKLIDLTQGEDYIEKYQENLYKDEKKRKGIFCRIAKIVFLFKYIVSISRTVRKEKVDVIFIFPRNHCLAIGLALLRFHHRAKIYFDLHVSMYSIATSNSLGKLTVVRYWVREFLSIVLANQLTCLTPEYAEYYQKIYKIGPDRFSVVHDGVQDIWFDEPVSLTNEVHHPKRVVYWGTFLIQHGLNVVINAAKELRNEEVEFILCGSGKGEAAIKKQARKKKLSNVVFKGFIPTTKELIRLIDSADVCLGFFRDTHDASFTIPIKVLQGMARGKQVVTMWNKHIEDLYQTKDNPFPPLILINSDPKSLAKAIIEIIKDPQKAEKIGNAARLTVERLHGVEAVTSALKRSLEKSI